MRLSRRKPKNQLDLGFVRKPSAVVCFDCQRELKRGSMTEHLFTRDHKRALARRHPVPRYRKPRVVHPFVGSPDYEDRMWAEQEAREREDETSRMRS